MVALVRSAMSIPKTWLPLPPLPISMTLPSPFQLASPVNFAHSSIVLVELPRRKIRTEITGHEVVHRVAELKRLAGGRDAVRRSASSAATTSSARSADSCAASTTSSSPPEPPAATEFTRHPGTRSAAGGSRGSGSVARSSTRRPAAATRVGVRTRASNGVAGAGGVVATARRDCPYGPEADEKSRSLKRAACAAEGMGGLGG